MKKLKKDFSEILENGWYYYRDDGLRTY